jgi:cytochrome P450
MNEELQPPKGAPLFNPWSPDFIADPYPFYRRLREADPMHVSPLGFRVASRHADVAAILRDKCFGKDFIGRMTRRSGPEILNEPVYRSMSHWMLQLDPPDHGRLRSLVVRACVQRLVIVSTADDYPWQAITAVNAPGAGRLCGPDVSTCRREQRLVATAE